MTNEILIVKCSTKVTSLSKHYKLDSRYNESDEHLQNDNHRTRTL